MIKAVIAFDVSGSKTNKKLSKFLKGFALRVQESVYEASLYYSDIAKVSQKIDSLINSETDSVIIYNMGKIDSSRIINIGKYNRNIADSILMNKFIII